MNPPWEQTNISTLKLMQGRPQEEINRAIQYLKEEWEEEQGKKRPISEPPIEFTVDWDKYFNENPEEEFYYRFPEYSKFRLDNHSKRLTQVTDEEIILDSNGTTLYQYKRWRQQSALQVPFTPRHFVERELDAIPDSKVIIGSNGESLADWKRRNPSWTKAKWFPFKFEANSDEPDVKSISFEECTSDERKEYNDIFFTFTEVSDEWGNSSDEFASELGIIDMLPMVLHDKGFISKEYHWMSKLDQLLKCSGLIQHRKGKVKDVEDIEDQREEVDEDHTPEGININTTTCYTSLTGGTYYVHDSVIPYFFLALIGDILNGKKKHQHYLQEVCSKGKNYHAFLDIDSPIDLTTEFIDVVAKSFDVAFRKHHEFNGKSKYLELHNKDNPTRKFHLYFPNLITTKDGLKIAVEELLAMEPTWNLFIDKSMSGLRLPYQGKAKDGKTNLDSMYTLGPSPSAINLVELLLMTKITAYEWEVPSTMKHKN